MSKGKLYPQAAEYLESIPVEELDELITIGGFPPVVIEAGHITGYEKEERAK